MYKKYSSLISSKKGAGLVILVEALVVYIIASLGIETGNLGYYIFSLVLVVDILRRFINLFKKSKNKVNAKNFKRKNA